MIKKTWITIFSLSLFILMTLTVSVEANVDIIPSKPKALGTIEITTQLTDENINAVYVLIEECSPSICWNPNNYTMIETTPDIYTKQITLTHKDATYLKYTIVVQTDEGWIEYEPGTQVNYDTSSSNTNGDTDSPGFEIVIIAISIMFISFITYRRKR